MQFSPPTNAVLATWFAPLAGVPTFHALNVVPHPTGAPDAELVRVDDAGTTATVTYAEPPEHPAIAAASAALHDAISGARLDGFELVSSQLDPNIGFLYLDADAARPTGSYRAVPVGALPTVDRSVAELVAALDAHGTSEPLR